ncbi:hypothetical protein GQ43DRAFT_429225 [Delitschia confertaspora ATCC 74209]|uniref:Uncharacterized protein n=1 Tax=Delitschia confertaspora ATCC 74209 TaxID=1513339 RepID=A0A9P4JX47_9PLEO|nr:hypothetical protein GQ43DRAFT_429225 [Delitschia confertaspora ATCC 74209]
MLCERIYAFMVRFVSRVEVHVGARIAVQGREIRPDINHNCSYWKALLLRGLPKDLLFGNTATETDPEDGQINSQNDEGGFNNGEDNSKNSEGGDEEEEKAGDEEDISPSVNMDLGATRRRGILRKIVGFVRGMMRWPDVRPDADADAHIDPDARTDTESETDMDTYTNTDADSSTAQS